MSAANDGIARDAPAPAQLAELYRLMGGFRISQAIYVVAELGVADLLADGPQGSDALAAATGADEDALYRVLRLLAGAGIFDEVAPRRFALAPLGAGLRRDVPGSIQALAVMLLGGPRWLAWGQLLQGVRTGEVPFDRAHGMPFFDYLGAHPEDAARFNRAMTGDTARSGDTIARAYDFSAIRRLVDVGGGHGLLLATILRAYPALRGMLFDLLAVVAGTPPCWRGRGSPTAARLWEGTSSPPLRPGATPTSCARSSTTGTTPARRRSWRTAGARWAARARSSWSSGRSRPTIARPCRPCTSTCRCSCCWAGGSAPRRSIVPSSPPRASG